MPEAREAGGMVKYQFEVDDDEWGEWKNTVPRSKALDQRIRELIRKDTGERDLEFEPVGAKNISYGPSSREGAAFVLRVGTEDGTVEIHLDEDEMYELWTEVQHTPWPEPLEEQTEAAELRQQLVDLAMGADAEMLRDALDALDPRWEER